MPPILRAFTLAGLVLGLLVGSVVPPPGARAQEATPVTAELGSLRGLLGLVPATMPEVGGASIPLVAYVDFAAQFAAVGIAPPDSIDDEASVRSFLGATPGLSWPSQLQQGAVQDPEGWADSFGFGLFDVDQALQYGDAPMGLLLVRGRFDRTGIAAALAKSGYRELAPIDGAAVFSRNAEAEMDLTAPTTALALGRMNNAAFLADGTLAFVPALADLRRVLATAAGRDPSLAERTDVAALLTAVDRPLSAAQIVSGDALRAVEGSDATPAAGGLPALPPVELALLGVTPGGPRFEYVEGGATPIPLAPGEPAAVLVFATLFADAGAAAAAVPVIEGRLATGRSRLFEVPYAELFTSHEVRRVPEEPVVVVTAEPRPDLRGAWWSLFLAQDLGFLAW